MVKIIEKVPGYFRYLNKFMVFMYRIGFGKFLTLWKEGFGQILILTHTGRKSGKIYQSGLNFARVDGEIYSIAGFGTATDWYRNLVTNPRVDIWINNEWFEAEAQVLPVNNQTLPIVRAVLISSGFAARVFGINPHTISDPQLAEITKDYCLVKFNRTAARTGDGGPGEYAWVWVLVSFLLLPFLFMRRK
jgi:deazaflavin-dependent oxidoreductase (nitroreductase family)